MLNRAGCGCGDTAKGEKERSLKLYVWLKLPVHRWVLKAVTLGLHDSQSSTQKKELTERMKIIKLKLEGSDKHVFASTFPP